MDTWPARDESSTLVCLYWRRDCLRSSRPRLPPAPPRPSRRSRAPHLYLPQPPMLAVHTLTRGQRTHAPTKNKSTTQRPCEGDTHNDPGRTVQRQTGRPPGTHHTGSLESCARNLYKHASSPATTSFAAASSQSLRATPHTRTRHHLDAPVGRRLRAARPPSHVPSFEVNSAELKAEIIRRRREP